MRKALLFMILLNSIACVTHNLAMDEELGDDLEMSQMQADVENDPEEQAQSDNENASESPHLEDPQPKKGPTLARKIFISAYTLLFILGPYGATIGSAVANVDGIKEMAQIASPISYISPESFINYQKKPGCTYEDYHSSYSPGGCARGKCEKNKWEYYECVIEKCESAEQYQKSCEKSKWAGAAMLFAPIVTFASFRKWLSLCKKWD